MAMAVSTRWLRPDSRVRIASASASSFGLPMIPPSRSSVVSAASTGRGTTLRDASKSAPNAALMRATRTT